MIDTLIGSAHQLADPYALLAIFVGSIIGFVFGAMPGLGSIQALALVLPFTFGWNPIFAMCFYAGIMGATTLGGSVSAILLNTPGTPINAATAFDGYPMAKRGEAGRALGLASSASVFGALFGLLVLVALIPFVEPIVLAFGPPEIFWLVLFGLVTISFASQANMLKGLAAGGLGILLSMVGYSNEFGVTRWIGDSQYLWDGIELVAFFVGIFAVSEVIHFTSKGGRIAGKGAERIELRGYRQVFRGALEVFRYPVTFLRSSMIGTIIGIIPGVGGAVANFVAYTTTVQVSKNRLLLGTGHPEGIIASEASNDAKDGGSIFPTLAFGIPGSAEMAVLLGAMILHGLHPGPSILQNHPEVIWALVLGLLLANVLASIFVLLSANSLTRLTFLPVYYIGPCVVILAMVGAYALRGNIWDVALMFLSGFFGYLCKQFGYPIICVAIGFVLGAIAESSFHHSLMISYGNYGVFFQHPISLTFMALTGLILVLSGVTWFRRRKVAMAPRPQDSNLALVFTCALAIFVLSLLAAAYQYATDVRLIAFVVGVPTLALLVIQIVSQIALRVSMAAAEASTGSSPALRLPIPDTDAGTANLPDPGGDGEQAGQSGGRAEWRSALHLSAWLIGFFALFFLVGFFASMPLFLIIFLRSQGTSWTRSVIVAVGVWTFCLMVFQWIFALKMWLGVIPEIASGILGGGITPPL